MRCQYISGLALQCKNILPPGTAVTPPSTNQSSSVTDNTTGFCEKHQAFVDTVKTHANVLRSAIDPGYKPLPHLSASELVSLPTKRSIPSHVFEPCCSVSTAFSEDNPLRNAVYMTDKEIVQQYNAALGRMINKVNDMRFIIHSRYAEHLKKKAAVNEERKKYKLVVKNAEERACLDRLKLDMSYARYNRAAATFLQKSYRKYKAEQQDLRGRENIKTWLETPSSSDMICEHEEPADSTKATIYVSPSVKNESDSTECVQAVLTSLLDAVEKQIASSTGKKRCNGRRIPMTDFCSKHLKLDPEIKLLNRCKECNAPCLDLDNGLCVIHAKKLFTPLPPQATQLPSVPTQTISQRLPSVKDHRIPRLAPMNTSGWTVGSRQLPHQMLTRESSGFTSITTIRKPEPVNYDISSFSGPLVVKSRRPRDSMQRILQGERQPNDTMLTEQSKLKLENSDNHQVLKIDDDLPIAELKKQCEQRIILDSTPSAPLQNQPKTKRSMLRLNGSNGNGVVIRGPRLNGPIAIIHQNPGVNTFNSNIPIIANRNNGKGIVPNGFGCARVRVFERNSDRKVRYLS